MSETTVANLPVLSVPLGTVEEVVRQILRTRGYKRQAVDLLCSDYINAELEGKSTHGLGKLVLLDQLTRERQGKPKVARRSGNVEVIDARRELGQLAARYAIERAMKLCKRTGVSAIAIVNMARYARLAFVGELIADAGLVGIVMNNAGPAAVTPYKGGTAILGTNPVCFAFPGTPNTIIDFSTAARPWGSIRQALLTGTKLPAHAFLDAKGNETHDPALAVAVRPFDGPKGYALCVAIELICGGMLTGIVGTDVRDEYDLGTLVICFNPAAFDGSLMISSAVAALRDQVHKSIGEARLPGDGSRARRDSAIAAGVLTINAQLWDQLRSMATGAASQLDINSKTNLRRAQ
jgi:L-2-hydroxycarboxylate dehydrogenase (NAD+)